MMRVITNSSDHSGGANGSIRLQESLEHPSNEGLAQWVDLIGKWRDDFKSDLLRKH